MRTPKLKSQNDMDNKRKINKGRKTRYIIVCTNFEIFILIHEAMNAHQGHSYVGLKLLWQGTKS